MHFLADHDVYKITVDQLREWGHDVRTVKELGMHRAADICLQYTNKFYATDG